MVVVLCIFGGDLVGLLTTMMRWGLLETILFPPEIVLPEAEVVARLTEIVGLLTVVVNVVVGADNSVAPEEVFRPCGC